MYLVENLGCQNIEKFLTLLPIKYDFEKERDVKSFD